MRPRLLLLLAIAFATGCGGSSPAATPECSVSGDCSASQVCLERQCVDALAQQYAVTLAIAVAQTEPDGTPWDNDGSAPDVEATLGSAGDPSQVSSVPVLNWDSQETFSARWDPVINRFVGGVTLLLNVQDSDTFGADPICQVQLPETVSVLHAGKLQVQGTSCQVTMTFAALPGTI